MRAKRVGAALRPPGGSGGGRLAPVLRTAAAGLLAGGCFAFGGPDPLATPALRPARQHAPTNQVVGAAVVFSAAGVAVSAEPLSADHLEALYGSRPGLVNPLKGLAPDGLGPLAFRLAVRNRGSQAVHMEPAQFLLRDQEGVRASPLAYQDFYQLLADQPDAEQRLRSVQATTYSSFVTVPPGGEREGFLYFPPLPASARLVVLELGSVYLGARELPLFLEFEVVRVKR